MSAAAHFPLAPASRVFVAGHRGLVGSAIVRRLEAQRPEVVFPVAGTVGGIESTYAWFVEHLGDGSVRGA